MARSGQGRGARRRLMALDAMREVPQTTWDALVGDASPFLEWAWLSALEDSGAASTSTGWTPRHLTLWEDARLLGGCPVYEKTHSLGEFVFDQGWATAALRAGIAYYPKLVVGVPFTPITGPRLLAAGGEREEVVASLAAVLEEQCRAGESSSVHVNFCPAEEVAELATRGWLRRTGLQYHWSNEGFCSFDDYLASLRSKRRNQVRRERREVAAAGVEVCVYDGPDIPDDVFPQMYDLYCRTIDHLPWGQRYLNRRFFDLVRERFRERLSFVVARRAGRVIAGAFNVEKADTLYGRYWGAREDVRYLHFEVCYYTGIEHCIRRGLKRFEPGAGGEFKHLRGFEAVPTESMHWVAHPGLAAAVREYLERERRAVAEEIGWFASNSALRRDRQEPDA